MVREIERWLLDSDLNLAPAQLDSLLHERFAEFAGQAFSRAQIVEAIIDGAGPARPTLLDQSVRLSPDAILLTYRTAGSRPALRTTVDSRHATGRWQAVHHHASPLSASPKRKANDFGGRATEPSRG